MALVSSKSDKKYWFYSVLKKYWRLSVTSGPRDLCDYASAKCFNSTYHIITTSIIAIPLGVSKIFDLEITMNYIGKNLRRHYDVTSGPIDTKLNNSFIASNYVTVQQIWKKSDDICRNYKYDAFGAFLYCTNTTGTGSCSSFCIPYKKLALVSSFQCTNIHSNQIISCKDIAVWAISRIMRIFPEPEVLSQKFEKSFLLFTRYTFCANFSSVALIAASESWC